MFRRLRCGWAGKHKYRFMAQRKYVDASGFRVLEALYICTKCGHIARRKYW